MNTTHTTPSSNSENWTPADLGAAFGRLANGVESATGQLAPSTELHDADADLDTDFDTAQQLREQRAELWNMLTAARVMLRIVYGLILDLPPAKLRDVFEGLHRQNQRTPNPIGPNAAIGKRFGPPDHQDGLQGADHPVKLTRKPDGPRPNLDRQDAADQDASDEQQHINAVDLGNRYATQTWSRQNDAHTPAGNGPEPTTTHDHLTDAAELLAPFERTAAEILLIPEQAIGDAVVTVLDRYLDLADQMSDETQPRVASLISQASASPAHQPNRGLQPTASKRTSADAEPATVTPADATSIVPSSDAATPTTTAPNTTKHVSHMPEYQMGRAWIAELTNAAQLAHPDHLDDSRAAENSAERILGTLIDIQDPELLRDFIAGAAREAETKLEQLRLSRA